MVFFWVWQANNLHQLTQNMTRIFWEFTWIKYVLKSVVDPDLEKCLFAFFFFLKSKDFSTYFIWSQTTFNWWKNEGLCRWESSYQKNFNPLLDFFGIVSDFLRFINKSLRYYIIKIKRLSCSDYGNKNPPKYRKDFKTLWLKSETRRIWFDLKVECGILRMWLDWILKSS